jgi:NAD(P)-dependent dehydrogenase (short-subunit alcohol dehydrogenase family)
MTQRTAIVTGAGSGIGRAICLRLARDGWHIALADINPDGSEETARLIADAGGTSQVELLDVSCEADWLDLRERLQSQWTSLDLLVNNAGVVATGSVHETPISDWDWLLSINLRGVILGCHTFVPWLLEHPQRSSLINISSVAGLISPAKMGAYNVSKAGVVALSETLDQELRSRNVGVTVVCPWFTQTNLLESGRFANPLDKDAGAFLMQNSWVTPEQVAESAVRAMYRRKLYAVVGFRAQRCWSTKRHMPFSYAWMAEWVQRRIVDPAAERLRQERENVTS